jgi:hypothetical protein
MVFYSGSKQAHEMIKCISVKEINQWEKRMPKQEKGFASCHASAMPLGEWIFYAAQWTSESLTVQIYTKYTSWIKISYKLIVDNNDDLPIEIFFAAVHCGIRFPGWSLLQFNDCLGGKWESSCALVVYDYNNWKTIKICPVSTEWRIYRMIYYWAIHQKLKV